MATINEIQDQIIEDFGLFDEWDDKYAYIIDLGKKLSGIDPKYKIEVRFTTTYKSNQKTAIIIATLPL